MPLCLKCEHEYHDSKCEEIEGKILGVDRICTCTMTREQNKQRKEKIRNRINPPERNQRSQVQ